MPHPILLSVSLDGFQYPAALRLLLATLLPWLAVALTQRPTLHPGACSASGLADLTHDSRESAHMLLFLRAVSLPEGHPATVTVPSRTHWNYFGRPAIAKNGPRWASDQLAIAVVFHYQFRTAFGDDALDRKSVV